MQVIWIRWYNWKKCN